MRLHIVNAFTDRPFTGNPAGVCLLPAGAWPDDDRMRRIAAEVNHPETAFALPLTGSPPSVPSASSPPSAPSAPSADWAIRWFTPVLEAELCGHATLATAHVLRTEHGVLGAVRFRSRKHGLLTAHTDADGSVTLDFPAAPATAAPAPAGLAEALGVTPDATLRTGALRDLLVVLPDEVAVRGVTPDPDALAALTVREGIRGVIVTAPGGPGADAPMGVTGATGPTGVTGAYDFVSRFFAPARGIPEDPVTGSAHTALAPYWSARLGRDRLTGHQVSARGGLVATALHGDRVHLTGRAVTILDGTLRV
ncbi:PhzF family phenazine biosynthesis protein [Kitasatospora sp. NPDC093806]|uniref:PhzF family phenazine biosynthesis protein n=1 Tax=Kitasatospora sp. NPDC093806 TaxID=3155075 RepID=UPI003417F71E